MEIGNLNFKSVEENTENKTCKQTKWKIYKRERIVIIQLRHSLITLHIVINWILQHNFMALPLSSFYRSSECDYVIS